MPEVYAEFVRATKLLEKHYRDMQDMEFTVERGKFWMLQTRNGKRTARAALRVAVEMANEGVIDRRGGDRPHRAGLARPVAASYPRPEGRAENHRHRPAGFARRGERRDRVHRPTKPRRSRPAGHKVILVRVETSPEDIHGMHAAEGILTTRGGMTSHAAVVARGMGKPCVSGAGTVRVDYAKQTLTAMGRTFERARSSPSTAPPGR